MEPLRLSQLTKSTVRKIVHDDPDYPKDQVITWQLTPQDRLVYVEAKSGPVCLQLPSSYDPTNTLIIKRVWTSRHNVYIKAVEHQIEGEVGGYLDEEDSSVTFRMFDNTWHVF